MKKSKILIFLVFFILSVPVFGSDRVDMVVLLDNSVSVLPYYDEIQESLLSRIILEHLEPGDSFSLITFADTAEVEISREIRNSEDIKNILAYSALLQPMGSHTDLITALRFLYKYTLDLPLNNRKKIVILTDGIHDPSENSPWYHSQEVEVKEEVEKTADRIHREGWDVSILQIEEEPQLLETGEDETEIKTESEESSENESAFEKTSDKIEGIDVIDNVSESLGSKPNLLSSEEKDMAGIVLGTPLVRITEDLGVVSGDFNIRLDVTNRSSETILFSLSQVLNDGNDILKEKESSEIDAGETEELEVKLKLPEGIQEGRQNLQIELRLLDGERISPDRFTLNFDYQSKKGFAAISNVFFSDWRILTVLISIIAAVLIIIIIKKAASSGTFHIEPVQKVVPAPREEPIQDGKDVKTKDSDDERSVQKTVIDEKRYDSKRPIIKTMTKERHEEDLGALTVSRPERREPIQSLKKNRPIHMYVYGQNTKTGVLNVIWLGLKKKHVVGSSVHAAFRIFFVKVPSVLAEIEYTGKDFKFTPVAMEYFPGLNSPIESCLNRRIKVITPEEKIFYIEFRQWISKLERLNKYLTMTRTPGSPDFDF